MGSISLYADHKLIRKERKNLGPSQDSNPGLLGEMRLLNQGKFFQYIWLPRSGQGSSAARVLHCDDFPEFIFFYSSLASFAESNDWITRNYFTDYVLRQDVPALHLVIKVSNRVEMVEFWVQSDLLIGRFDLVENETIKEKVGLWAMLLSQGPKAIKTFSASIYSMLEFKHSSWLKILTWLKEPIRMLKF